MFFRAINGYRFVKVEFVEFWKKGLGVEALSMFIFGLAAVIVVAIQCESLDSTNTTRTSSKDYKVEWNISEI